MLIVQQNFTPLNVSEPDQEQLDLTQSMVIVAEEALIKAGMDDVTLAILAEVATGQVIEMSGTLIEMDGKVDTKTRVFGSATRPRWGFHQTWTFFDKNCYFSNITFRSK